VNLEWSPLALARVSEIASYIALDKPPAAETWVDGLFESVERLKSYPKSGRKVPEVGIERIREIVYGGYRVIYGVDERAGKISVLTVRRGSEMLREEELKL
jgi:toxin ParE1/3/4